MKMKRTFSVITMLVILVLGVTGCKKKVEGIALDKTELVVTHGAIFVLNATLLPNDAADQSVAWSINSESNSVVVTTKENTLQKEFFAGNLGNARISVVSSNGQEAFCDVRVIEDEEDKAAREKEEKEAEERAKEEAKVAAEDKTKESVAPAEDKTKESVALAKSTGNQTMSEKGVNFSELTLIPDRGIITVKIENTTRVAKKGFIGIACLDEDGLQLKKSTIHFDINALTDDIIQSDKIPSGTVSVKFLSTVVLDK